jgi:hypothetical protein
MIELMIFDVTALPGAHTKNNRTDVMLVVFDKWLRSLGEPSDPCRPKILMIAGGDTEKVIQNILAEHRDKIAPREALYIDRVNARIDAAWRAGVAVCHIVPFGTPQIIPQIKSERGIWQIYSLHELLSIVRAQQPVY